MNKEQIDKQLKNFVLKLLQDNIDLEDLLNCNLILYQKTFFDRNSIYDSSCRALGCKQIKNCIENEISHLLSFLKHRNLMNTHDPDIIIQISDDVDQMYHPNEMESNVITRDEIQLLINLKKL